MSAAGVSGGAFPWRGAPEIVPVRDLRARVIDEPWRWAEANSDAIARHWAAALSRRPRLFNGKVLLAKKPDIVDGVLYADYMPVDFAAFLAWRDMGWPDASVVNGFSMAALRSSDGAWVAGVQGPDTANAGAIYFAAGTPDLADVRADGSLDLVGNIHREIREETGLDAAAFSFDDQWSVVFDGGRVAMMREARSGLTAEELAARIDAWVAADPNPELSGAAVIRSMADVPEGRAPTFMSAWLAWRLGRQTD